MESQLPPPHSRTTTEGKQRAAPTPCCRRTGLKRGPWTAEEDEVLASFVRREGEGRWRTLPKRAGLLRCGKSCRLRWMNYLRPSIKRGPISADEEDLILRLYRLLGNRWSLISGRIPGRTDNEIKNYWNTHLSKKLIEQGIDPRTHKPFASPSTNPNTSTLIATEAAAAAAAAAASRKEEHGHLGYFDGLNLPYAGGGSGIKLGMDQGVVFSGFFDSFVDEDIIYMQQLHGNNNSNNNYSRDLAVINEKNKQVEVAMANPPVSACLGFESVLWEADAFAAYSVNLGEGFPGVYRNPEGKY